MYSNEIYNPEGQRKTWTTRATTGYQMNGETLEAAHARQEQWFVYLSGKAVGK